MVETDYVRRPSGTRFGEHGYLDHPATPLIAAALDRKGWSVAHVFRRIGVRSSSTLHGWLTGEHVPYYDNLAAFARELELPELLNLIAFRHRRIKLTCTECTSSVELIPGVAKQRQTAVYDPRTGEGSYVCMSCHAKQQVLNLAPNRVSREIARGYAVRKKKFGTVAADKWSAGLRSKLHKPSGAKLGNSSRTGQKQPEAEILKRSGRIMSAHHRPASYVFDYCCWCDQIVRSHPDRPGITHKTCYKTHHGQIRNRSRGRRLSRSELADTYEMTIRHVLRHETIEELASEFGMAPMTAKDRIRDFVRALPEDDRGGAKLQRMAKVLRWARGKE